MQPPLWSATACGAAALLLILPRPDLVAACVLLFAASYLCLQHYSAERSSHTRNGTNGHATKPAESSPELLAERVAERVMGHMERASGLRTQGSEMLAAIARANDAEAAIKAWELKCQTLTKERASWRAEATKLTQLLNQLSTADGDAAHLRGAPAPAPSMPSDPPSPALGGLRSGGSSNGTTSPGQVRRRHAAASKPICTPARTHTAPSLAPPWCALTLTRVLAVDGGSRVGATRSMTWSTSRWTAAAPAS